MKLTRFLMLTLTVFLLIHFQSAVVEGIQQEPEINLAGYTLLPKEKCPEKFNAGFSMYPTVWSLVETHPGKRYQSGLFSTWMKVKTDQEMNGKIGSEKTGGLGYTSVEGGAGVWRHNRFPTITPKFQMGGVALSFRGIANGPGFGKGRDWTRPVGRYGVAQLSPHVLFPLDGLNFKQGTFGESIGYGYLPLPLTPEKTTTAGEDVPTGNHSWTLFIDSGNFKGPLAFFTPYFWSRHTIEYPQLHGNYFDSRLCRANRQIQMETQHIAARQAMDNDGNTYARLTPVTFPLDENGLSHVFTGNTCYDKSALWDSVDQWFQGGEVASGQINLEGSFTTRITGGNQNNWKFFVRHKGEKTKFPVNWNEFASREQTDDFTLTFRFDPEKTKHDPENGRVTLPEYFRMITSEGESPKWIAVDEESVPQETGLHQLTPEDFYTGDNENSPWTTPVDGGTPVDGQTAWNEPGPTAGPFQVKTGDGSTVTYYWYRFCEQPAIMMADLTDDQREQLQRKVELIHEHWKPDGKYLPTPDGRTLADLDPALLVTAPEGLEIGYVPIATRQEIEK